MRDRRIIRQYLAGRRDHARLIVHPLVLDLARSHRPYVIDTHGHRGMFNPDGQRFVVMLTPEAWASCRRELGRKGGV